MPNQPKYMIRGGSAMTTRASQRVRCAYGFEGPAGMLSHDLGFRTFRNHRERGLPAHARRE